MTLMRTGTPAATAGIRSAGFRAAGLVMVLGLAACGGFRSAAPSGPAPLQPAPTTPVQTLDLPPPAESLPPPAETPVDQAAAAAEMQQTQQAAIEVKKTDLSGAWTVTSGGETCKLFTTLTTWSGGYRALTRGCSSAELQAIGAWDLSGKEVTLKDASGSPVARLYATAPLRYAGQLEVSKRGVQFFR